MGKQFSFSFLNQQSISSSKRIGIVMVSRDTACVERYFSRKSARNNSHDTFSNSNHAAEK